MSSMEAKSDQYSAIVAHLATGCGINAKDPSGDAFRFVNPARGGRENPLPRGLSL